MPRGVPEIDQPLAGAVLLAAWERCGDESPPARALALLRAGCPALGEEEAAGLPLSVRDQALIALHARSFGPSLSAFAACPSCGEQLEFTLAVRQVAAALQAADLDCALTEDGVTLRLRQASTRDIADAAVAPDLESACDMLLARCAEALDGDGRPVALPEARRKAALERLEAMQAAAEVSVGLVCPGCSVPQTIYVDVASFLWDEIRPAAQRLLGEVHELAWAYGWTESAILAMSRMRRRAYLDHVRR
jgi:hypothetical protein